jgi:hypothetical protein
MDKEAEAGAEGNVKITDISAEGKPARPDGRKFAKLIQV